MEFDLKKTQVRIQETEKVVESCSYDIRSKQTNLEDTQREISRMKDLNSQQNVEILALRKDVDRVSTDCYDIRKQIEAAEARNADLSGQVRSQDIQLKDKEESLYTGKREVENLQYTNQNMRRDLNDYLQEKDALERHSRILLG